MQKYNEFRSHSWKVLHYFLKVLEIFESEIYNSFSEIGCIQSSWNIQ